MVRTFSEASVLCYKKEEEEESADSSAQRVLALLALRSAFDRIGFYRKKTKGAKKINNNIKKNN